MVATRRRSPTRTVAAHFAWLQIPKAIDTFRAFLIRKVECFVCSPFLRMQAARLVVCGTHRVTTTLSRTSCWKSAKARTPSRDTRIVEIAPRCATCSWGGIARWRSPAKAEQGPISRGYKPSTVIDSFHTSRIGQLTDSICSIIARKPFVCNNIVVQAGGTHCAFVPWPQLSTLYTRHTSSALPCIQSRYCLRT